MRGTAQVDLDYDGGGVGKGGLGTVTHTVVPLG